MLHHEVKGLTITLVVEVLRRFRKTVLWIKISLGHTFISSPSPSPSPLAGFSKSGRREWLASLEGEKDQPWLCMRMCLRAGGHQDYWQGPAGCWEPEEGGSGGGDHEATGAPKRHQTLPGMHGLV